MTPHRGRMALLNKPAGITSYQALEAIKRKCKTKKVGHSGTLDKFAEGLLIALIEGMTKTAFIFSRMDKVYRVTIRFGIATDTLDGEGDVVAQGCIPTEEIISRAIDSLLGDIDQVPPQYSAVHIRGQRAYKLARSGQSFTLPSRRVTIHSASIIRHSPPDLELRIHCSKGTYIRAFARDLAYRAGTVAYVTKLVRIRIGRFDIEDAVSIQDFNSEHNSFAPVDFFKKIDDVEYLQVAHPCYRRMILNGLQPQYDFFSHAPKTQGLCAVFDQGKDLIALVEHSAGRFEYRRVFGNGR